MILLFFRAAVRGTFVLAIISPPALAAELESVQARKFIVGRHWSFHCFEGTTGSGRVLADGSISGVYREHGDGPIRQQSYPPATFEVRQGLLCADGQRLFGVFTPCFTINQRDRESFHGSIRWLPFLSCDFKEDSL
jgi:hypothetical protein